MRSERFEPLDLNERNICEDLLIDSMSEKVDYMDEQELMNMAKSIAFMTDEELLNNLNNNWS